MLFRSVALATADDRWDRVPRSADEDGAEGEVAQEVADGRGPQRGEFNQKGEAAFALDGSRTRAS